MQIEKFSELYKKNNLSKRKLNKGTQLLEKLNDRCDYDLDKINTLMLDDLIKYLVKKNMNEVDNFVILMRYFKMIKRDDLYIHLTKYTGMLDVIENIVKRLKVYIGKTKADLILKNYQYPYLGVSPYELPKYTSEFMRILEENLDEETVQKAVTGNNHGISKKAMLPEKVEYENSESLESYLKERHQRKVDILNEHYEKNEIWFEQKITKDVVDLVKSNQEMLSAVLKDEKLFITKIPYEPDKYIKAETLEDKRYFGCHCPFVREAIKAGKPLISDKFCYCSAGFAKFPFEVILNQKLEIKCLETILSGSDKCRFEIDLKDINYKK